MVGSAMDVPQAMCQLCRALFAELLLQSCFYRAVFTKLFFQRKSHNTNINTPKSYFKIAWTRTNSSRWKHFESRAACVCVWHVPGLASMDRSGRHRPLAAAINQRLGAGKWRTRLRVADASVRGVTLYPAVISVAGQLQRIGLRTLFMITKKDVRLRRKETEKK